MEVAHKQIPRLYLQLREVLNFKHTKENIIYVLVDRFFFFLIVHVLYDNKACKHDILYFLKVGCSILIAHKGNISCEVTSQGRGNDGAMVKTLSY